MGDQSNRRQRAVRLTEEALALFRARLTEEWSRLGLPGRLNREARAALLEVSVSTAERIIHRKGNDRAVLQHAFAKIGLPWDESYCEPMPGGEQVQPTPPKQPVLRNTILRWGIPALILPTLLAAWAFTRRDNGVDPMSYQLVESGRRAYHSGNYDEAERKLKLAAERSSSHRQEDQLAETFRLEGELRAAKGDFAGARELYNKALVIFDSFGTEWAEASLLEALGVVETKLGRYREAERHLTESLAVLRKLKDPRGAACTLRSLGVLYATQGDALKAHRHFFAAEQEMKQNPDENLLMDMRAQRALLASLEGDPAGALLELQTCLRHWERVGHRRWIATTQLQIAQVMARAGHGDADELAYAARKNYLSVGDQFGIDQCDALLRRTQVGTTNPHPR